MCPQTKGDIRVEQMVYFGKNIAEGGDTMTGTCVMEIPGPPLS